MRRTLFLFLLATAVFLAGQISPLQAYTLMAQKMPSSNFTLNLQLSSATYSYPLQYWGGYFPTPGLQDFSATWNDVAQAALNEWNQYLLNAQFVSNTNSATAPVYADGISSVFFTSTIYGQSFGSGTLAITLRRYIVSNNLNVEADVLVNTAIRWDSYRGNLQYSWSTGYTYDLRRVLIHEFGHIVGLGHPDLDTPAQSVVALMNSTASDLDHLEIDDINGAMFLFGTKTILRAVSLTASPSEGGTVTGGGNYQIGSTRQITATPASGWIFAQWSDGNTNPTRSIAVPLQDVGYTATFKQSLDSWAVLSSGTITNLGSILYVNGTFMAFGSNGVATSADGVTWTSKIPATQVNYNPNAVVYAKGTFVSVGSAGQIWTSSDGINWTLRPTGLTTDNFSSVTYGNGLFVAVGGTTTPSAPTPVVTSTDGITWTPRTGGVIFSSKDYSSVIYANGMFVAVGGYGVGAIWGDTVMRSMDGVTWATESLPNGSSLGRLLHITYGNGLFVAGTDAGNLVSSTDALNWTQRAFQYYNYWNVIYANHTFLAMQSKIETSPDGINWTARDSGSVAYANGMAFGGGRFIGAGLYGIYQSGLVPAQAVQPVLPVVNSAAAGTATTSTAFTYQITATNTPLAFNAAGLPPGLSINMATGTITGSPTTTGTYPVTLFATNDAGSGTATLTITVSALTQSFSQWAGAHTVVGGAAGIPQHDGVPNLLKYFSNIDPSRPMTLNDRAALPAMGVTTTNSTPYLTLTYRRNALLTGVTIGVQTSTDLKTWQTVTPDIDIQSGTDAATGDPIRQVGVNVTGKSSAFIRLNVTAP